MIPQRWTPLWKAAGFLATYGLAWAILSGPSVHRDAVVWLPTGVAVAGLWLLGERYWWVIALGTILHRTGIGRPLELSILPATGNVLEALIAVVILRRLAFQPACDRLRDSLILLLAAAVAPLASTAASLYQYYLVGYDWGRIGSFTAGWWRMNALGILVLVPLVLTWGSARGFARPTRRDLFELGGLVIAVLLQLHFVILAPRPGELTAVLPFLTLPIVFYAAVRLGPRWAALTGFVFTVLAVRSSMAGFGPFLEAPLEPRMLALQIFLAILAVTPLMLAAAVAEREAATAGQIRSDAARDAFQRLLPDITYRIRGDGTYLDMYVPPGAAPPYPREELVGRRVSDLAPPAIANRVLQSVRTVLAGGASELVEFQTEANGRLLSREARFVRLGPDEVLSLVRDITDRKWAESALAWQAGVLELVATGQPTAAVLDALVHGIERLSQGGLCSVLLLQGTRLHVATAASLPKVYNAAIEGLEIGPSEGSCGTAAARNISVVVADIATDPLWSRYRHLALPHGLRACWSVPIRDSAGAVLGTFAVYYHEPRSPEPGELALVERAGALAGIAIERERHEELLASINRNVNEGLYRSTPDRGLIYVNSAFARMFGYDSPEEMLQLTSAMLYEDPARREELKRVIVAQGFFTNEEVRFLRRDGTTFWGLVSSTGVRDNGGVLQYYDGAVADITARKQLEEQLRQAQKMEAVGRLAGGVAHDFNNLLTAIVGYADGLLTTLPPGAPAQADAEEILRAAERAAALTRQLLAYSRQQVLSPQVLDLRDVVEQLGGMLRRLIGEDVRLVTQHAGGQAWVRVDRGQIEQVILNLVLNARDAMPEGGTLTIGTLPVELDQTSARTLPDLVPGSYLALTVGDNGVGMDAETRRRAFDPFFTTKEPGKGTGLGLSTVDGIVRQSGGTTILESTPRAGTTVRVYLPRVTEPPRSPAEATAVQIPSGAGGTILVVEDEQLVRDLVSRTLRRAGYTVLVAENGQDALALSRQTSGVIDLAVTDVIMPRMGGRELTELLLRERPGIRVLLVSGYTNEALNMPGVLGPGTEYLQKPFTASVLLGRVRDLLAAERVRS